MMQRLLSILVLMFCIGLTACDLLIPGQVETGRATATEIVSSLTVLPERSKIFIRIFKREALLEIWAKTSDADTYKLVKSFPICAYSGELGPKEKEGDNQAPEGFYEVSAAALNPNSAYHLSFNLGFPNTLTGFMVAPEAI